MPPGRILLIYKKADLLLTNLAMKDQVKILDGIRNGDPSAWEIFFRQHYATACSLAYRFLKDEDQSKEVVAEVFSKLWLMRERFITESDIRFKLYYDVKYRSFDYLKRRQKNRATGELPENIPVSEEEEQRIAERMDMAILYKDIFDEINRLPGRCREVMRMLYHEDKSVSEVAAELGIEQNTVSTYKKRSIIILRGRLAKYRDRPDFESLILISVLIFGKILSD
jgi:RNA polymerase sigma factor (sigma-70 family)